MSSSDRDLLPGRRVLLRSIALLLSAPAGLLARSQASTGQAFEVVLPSKLLPGLRDDPAYSRLKVMGDPASIDPTRGLPLIYIAVGVLLLPEIARALTAVYRDYRHGGTVVEVRGGKLMIRHDDALAGDTIILKDAEGKLTIHQSRSSTDTAKWVEILTSAAKK